MLSPYIHAALAHERHQEFLAQAKTSRRGRQARLHRRQAGTPGAHRSPVRWRPAWLQPGPSRLLGHWPRSAVTGRPVVLRDGSTVLIRPVRPVDAPLLADGFARLSARSRQLRFLTPKKDLSPTELRYLTDVDHHDHEALGALNHPGGRGVGVAGFGGCTSTPAPKRASVTTPTTTTSPTSTPTWTELYPPTSLWVPRTSSTSCDQAVFVDHATDASVSSDTVLLKIDRFG